jgi:hypothetical protein
MEAAVERHHTSLSTYPIAAGNGLLTMRLPRVPELAGAQILRQLDSVFVFHTTEPRIALSFHSFVGEADLERLVAKASKLHVDWRETKPTVAFGVPAIRERGERPCNALSANDECDVLHVEILYVVIGHNGFILYIESDARFPATTTLAEGIVAATSFGAFKKLADNASVTEIFDAEKPSR